MYKRKRVKGLASRLLLNYYKYKGLSLHAITYLSKREAQELLNSLSLPTMVEMLQTEGVVKTKEQVEYLKCSLLITKRLTPILIDVLDKKSIYLKELKMLTKPDRQTRRKEERKLCNQRKPYTPRKSKVSLSEREKRGRPSYSLRNAILKDMGYPNYEAYISSELWKDIRSMVLMRDNYQCVFCKMTTKTVHHRDYKRDTLKGHNPKSLISTCKGCHTKIEFTKGKKRTLVNSQRKCNDMLVRKN